MLHDSLCVACAVCASCHKNSVVRRKKYVRFSHRTALFHWLSKSGRSRYEWTHLLYIVYITVSDVGRIASFSFSSSPPPCDTIASSGENPSICFASLFKSDRGMKMGKYEFRIPK